jgi:hypothetical protein
MKKLRIPANVTADSGDRDRWRCEIRGASDLAIDSGSPTILRQHEISVNTSCQTIWKIGEHTSIDFKKSE